MNVRIMRARTNAHKFIKFVTVGGLHARVPRDGDAVGCDVQLQTAVHEAEAAAPGMMARCNILEARHGAGVS